MATASPHPARRDALSASPAEMANALRALAMDAVEAAKSGHPGMPMGMADVATVLFTRFLKYDPADPAWPDRDRFVLSAGHGSMLLYGLLHLTGYADMTLDELKRFRQLESRTPGHPEYGCAAGVETTTGPLGQGFATAVGMALAERHMAARFGAELVDHRTWVIASDGDLMEGISHEAASLAGHLGLGKLTVLYDDNHISIDGDTELALSDDVIGRFASYGWHTARVSGHDPEAIAAAIADAQAQAKPALIACRTTIAFGAPKKAGTAASHGSPLGAEEIAGARKALNWPYPPFVVPDAIRTAWRAAGERGAAPNRAWRERVSRLDGVAREDFRRAVAGDLPPGWDDALVAFKKRLADDKPNWATRKASGETLEVLVPAIPGLLGGSADLTGSVNTLAKGMAGIESGAFDGRYVHYGVREHAMAAAMNGMALHGGIIPYGGTFLIFSDYLRPALRLSALMRQRVIYVLTHDSIGLGEDGPTHQPVEQLAALRAIPGLRVFRPADAIETAECWQLALESRDHPSALALTRQGVPALRTTHVDENLCARGGYVLSEAEGAKATLIGTGSEVQIALAARDMLAEEGIPARVVSMPCWALFEAQPGAYRDYVLGPPARVAVEAAVSQGWDRFLGPFGAFVGMTGFGASAPDKALYAHFGITAKAVADAACDALGLH
jgi:transketolase